MSVNRHMLMIRAWTYAATVILALQLHASAQKIPVEAMSPTTTVLVADLVRETGADTKRTTSGAFAVRSVAEASGKWAVLIGSSKGNTVVTGDVVGGSPNAFNTDSDVRQFAIDQSGHIHLLHNYQRDQIAGGRRVSVMDELGHSVNEYTFPALATEGVHAALSRSGVTWVTEQALVTATSFRPLLQLSKSQDLNDAGVQMKYVGSLSVGGYFTFGSGSEIITLHNTDGSVSGSFPAPLDQAYQAIGHPMPKPAVWTGGGPVRVIWAASNSNDQLYVCLSGLKTAGPGYIAVVDAKTGTLLKVIAVSLPAFPELVTAVNPLGTVIPGQGAVDDHLVIADQKKGSLSIY